MPFTSAKGESVLVLVGGLMAVADHEANSRLAAAASQVVVLSRRPE
jgi:hypothetical protein